MNPLYHLSLYGVTASLVGDNVKLSGLDRVPLEDFRAVQALVEEVKARKPEIIEALRWNHAGYSPVAVDEGEIAEVILDANDMDTLRRWKAALEAGTISLVGKVQYRLRSQTVTIRYRCAAPVEWVEKELIQ